MSDLAQLFKTMDQQQFAPIYFFHGAEKLLFHSIEEKVKAIGEENGFAEMNLTRFEGDGDVGQWLDSCETLPVFAPVRIVIVRAQQAFVGKETGNENENQRFLSYIEAPNPTTVLLIHAENTDAKNEVFKALTKSGYVHELDKLDRKDLIKWILKRVKGHGKEIDGTTVAFFIEQSAYLDKLGTATLYDLQNSIDQICQHTTQSVVERDDIIKLVEKSVEHTLFEMTDYIGNRQTELAISTLKDLLEQGENALYLLSMIGRHFRQLKKVKHCANQGMNPTVIAERCDLKLFVAKKCHAQATRFDEKMLDYLIEACVQADYKMKQTAVKMDDELTLLVIKACFVHHLC